MEKSVNSAANFGENETSVAGVGGLEAFLFEVVLQKLDQVVIVFGDQDLFCHDPTSFATEAGLRALQLREMYATNYRII